MFADVSGVLIRLTTVTTARIDKWTKSQYQKGCWVLNQHCFFWGVMQPMNLRMCLGPDFFLLQKDSLELELPGLSVFIEVSKKHFEE